MSNKFNGFDTSQYVRMNHDEHVLSRPDTYVGSTHEELRESYVLLCKGIRPDLDEQITIENIYKSNIKLPPGVVNTFAEVETNAADAVERGRSRGVGEPAIDIQMNKEWVSVTNYTDPIPVLMHDKEKMYVPELILGTLLTSQNYDDNVKRNVAGRNGYGSKITNIFSKIFKVDIGDNYNKKRYIQTWQNNMTIKSNPDITDYNGVNYVNITYLLDFNRFGITEYPDEAFWIFAKMAADTAMTTKTVVKFNNKIFKFPYIEDYVKLYTFNNQINELPNHIINHTWESNIPTYIKNGITYTNKNVLPETEFIILDTPNNGNIVSFVNGINTSNHGIHVDTILTLVFDKIIQNMNDTLIKAMSKKSEEDKIPKITIRDIKKHITMFVAVRVVNPEFVDQIKSKLNKPKPILNIKDDLFNDIKNWDMVEVIYDRIKAKQQNNLKSKNFKYSVVVKDANKAGSKDSYKCTCLYVEGNSASNYPEKYRTYLGREGNDYYGIFVGGGVPLNARNSSSIRIMNNKFITNLFKFLGLEYDIDYTIPENRNKLRYGKLVILTDADDDGAHIGGLVISNLESQFKSILPPTLINNKEEQYLYFMRTKYVSVNGLTFYTEEDYNTWKNNNPTLANMKAKYYKGLGTNKDSDIKEETKNPKLVCLNYDNDSNSYLDLAFHNKYADMRKNWILNYTPPTSLTSKNILNISEYVNYEVIKHSLANVKRTLPRAIDGLKEVQRKIIYGCSQEFKWGRKNDSLKVYMVGADVTKRTSYHHGDMSMNKSIITLAQDFLGTNNISLLYPDGQFGTREKLGEKDNASSPRYISVRLNDIFPYIFREEDLPILDLQEIEGEMAEPNTMLPVIPLVNGAKGIATGWSTYVPNYNPLEIATWLLRKLNGKNTIHIMPWYRGFSGRLICTNIIDDTLTTNNNLNSTNTLDNDNETNNDDNNDIGINEDVVNIDKNTHVQLEIYGLYHKDNTVIKITELPVGISTNKYRNYLNELKDKGLLKSYTDYSNSDNIDFLIHGYSGDYSSKGLRLIKNIGLSNFMFLDINNKPIKFKTIYDYLEYFYAWRLHYYEKRKVYMLNKLLTQIKDNEIINKYLELSLSGTIKTGMTTKNIVDILTPYGIDWSSINKKITINKTTHEHIDKLKTKINKLKAEYNNLYNTQIQQLWINDINEFIENYRRLYKDTNVNINYLDYNDKILCLYRDGDNSIKIYNNI